MHFGPVYRGFEALSPSFWVSFCTHVNLCDKLDKQVYKVYNEPMYIDTIPNRDSPPTVLLRQSWREGGKMRKRTLANLTKLGLPDEAIEALRQTLKGVELVPKEQAYATERALPAGHVQAVLGMARKLGMDTMLSSRPCREQQLVLAMVVQRLITPCSKLAMTRLWDMTTLARELELQDANENELYAALDWLAERQERIEKKLASRHLEEGAQVLYDVSSSTYYGRACPLAAHGNNRDQRSELCIVYGLLTDAVGRPIAVQVYPGNTGDPATLPDQVNKVRDRFGLERVVLVGDRGMLTQARIEALRTYPQLGWISALRASGIRKLVQEGSVQMSFFDDQQLAEIHSELFPGERLVVCYNPVLAEDRRRTRNELLDATERQLKRLAAQVAKRTKKPMQAEEIGLRAGKILNSYKVGKHFDLTIEHNAFSFARNEERIAEEAALDGIYVVRTSEGPDELSAEDAVRSYKGLAQVEEAFRCLKGLDIHIRPIHHRTPKRVRAHVFVCMLAYYIEWHMRQALAPVLFQDEERPQNRWTRDPVGAAQPSESACGKKREQTTADGWPVHSYRTLLDDLATRTRNICRVGQGKHAVRFEQDTELTPFQQHVFELLGVTPK